MATIVHINEKNIALFIPMLPKYIKEELANDEDILLFGIESEDTAAGVCAVRITAPGAEILWYYLHPSFRGTGEAMDGFTELSMILHDSYRVDMLTADIPADTGGPMEHLLSGYPVTWVNLPECRFTTTVDRLFASKRLTAAPRNCISLSKLDKDQLLAFCRTLKQNNEDHIPLPIDPKDYVSGVSAVYMQDDVPKGLLLVAREGRGLTIPLLFSAAKDSMSICDMLNFVRKSLAGAAADTPITMNLANPRLKSIACTYLELSDNEEGFKYNKRAIIDLIPEDQSI